MDRRKLIQHSSAAIGLFLLPNRLLFGGMDPLPDISILGDSISIGYTDFVRKKLEGKANVFRPMKENGNPWNCQGTTQGVEYLDTWPKDQSKWDIIHFNFGLHDLKHIDPETGKNSKDPFHPQQAALKQYKKNLKKIVKGLKTMDAQSIFATTTPFPDIPEGPLRHADQPVKYNKVALKIMNKNDIPINDLYGFVLPQMNKMQILNNVHITKKGPEMLDDVVVYGIKTYI